MHASQNNSPSVAAFAIVTISEASQEASGIHLALEASYTTRFGKKAFVFTQKGTRDKYASVR